MPKTRYYPRELARSVKRALRIFPVVVLSGARQTGKTTMIREEKELSERTYFSLDELDLLAVARREPESILEAAEQVTIDEVQRAPEIFLAMKRIVDRRRRPGQFLVSGSANLELLAATTDTLAGRACYLALGPLTAREASRNMDEEPFVAVVLSNTRVMEAAEGRTIAFGASDVLKGGLPVPRLLLGDDYREWFRAYEQTYIERDVRQLTQVADLGAFRTLLHLAAHRTAQVLNQTELGRDAGLNAMTTRRYISLLETSWISYRLRPFYTSRAKQMVKSPKLYISDSGLAAFLCGVGDLSSIGEPLRGALLETYVAQNLLATLEVHLRDGELCFWRKHKGGEIDFIISKGNKMLAIEVKWSSRLRSSDFNVLEKFTQNNPRCVAGIVAYSGKETRPLGERLWAVPLDVLLS